MDPTTARRRDTTGWVVALAMAIGLAVVGWLRHRNGWSGGLDLGIFDQGVWLLSEGLAPEVTVNGRNLFADHLSPVLVLFVPFYILTATPVWLLAGQAAAIGAGLPAMRRLAGAHGVSTTAVTVAYVVSAPLLAAAVFDFHPSTLAVAPLCWLLVAVRSERRWPVVALCAAVLACRADLGWSLVALAVAAPARHRWTLVGIGLGGMAAGFAVPAILGGEGTWEIHYGHIADSPSGVVSQPWELLTAFSAKDLTIVFLWALAGGLLVVLQPKWAIAALVASLPILVSRWPGSEDPYNHYGAPIAPLVLAGAIGGLATRHRYAQPRYLIVGAVVAAFLAGPLPPKAPEERSVRTAFVENFDGRLGSALDAVGDGEPVAAVMRVLPHLTHRRLAYGWPIPFVEVPLAALYGGKDDEAAETIDVVIGEPEDRDQMESFGFTVEDLGPLLVGRR